MMGYFVDSMTGIVRYFGDREDKPKLADIYEWVPASRPQLSEFHVWQNGEWVESPALVQKAALDDALRALAANDQVVERRAAEDIYYVLIRKGILKPEDFHEKFIERIKKHRRLRRAVQTLQETERHDEG